MKRFLEKIEVDKLIEDNFNSVAEFCRELNISRSHFDGMIKREIACGRKTQNKLKNLLKGYGIDIEDLLEPLPIIIGDKKVKEIIISDNKNRLIVSINSNSEISDKNYKVEYIPFF